MSLLNQLFNRGLQASKCKTCLTLAVSRIKLLQNKRDVQLKLMRKEIAQFLQTGQEAIAQIRVEHVIREQNIWAAYEILEMFCEFVLARVPILESQRECPSELREAVASIIFAAPRCSDLPDLLHVRNLFAAKYGKEFVAAASELRPDTSVNRTIVEKLSVSTPSPQVKLKLLKEIAREYNVEWDSSKTESELSRKPEDLLNGPKQIATVSQVSVEQNSRPSCENSLLSTNGKQRREHDPQSPGCVAKSKTRPLLSADTNKASYYQENSGEAVTDIRDKGSASSNVMERAENAIMAAERASAAARAAAKLVNVKFEFVKVEEQNS
nr:IST1 homolog [Ipomoea trifida]